MADPYMAEIRLFSFSQYAPKGWAFCNGQLLPINQNQALFSLLGTTYGGNGQTNFGLPDLRGRTPIAYGSSHSLGERAGTETVTINLSQMPAHTHFVGGNANTAGNAPSPIGNFFSNSAPPNIYSNGVAGATFPGNTVTQVGGSQPHTNIQPYLTINFCIALVGIYPSQT